VPGWISQSTRSTRDRPGSSSDPRYTAEFPPVAAPLSGSSRIFSRAVANHITPERKASQKATAMIPERPDCHNQLHQPSNRISSWLPISSAIEVPKEAMRGAHPQGREPRMSSSVENCLSKSIFQRLRHHFLRFHNSLFKNASVPFSECLEFWPLSGLDSCQPLIVVNNVPRPKFSACRGIGSSRGVSYSGPPIGRTPVRYHKGFVMRKLQTIN